MTKLGAEERLVQEVQAACGAVLARQHEDGSWSGDPAPPPRGPWGPPPELAWLAGGPPALQVPRAILAGRELPWTPFRGRAHARCVNWLLDHLDEVDAELGLAALEALRFPPEHRAVGRLTARRGQLTAARHTAEALTCLQEAGVTPEHPQLLKAVNWLLAHPVREVSVTARVLLALSRACYADPVRLHDSILAGMRWLLDQQRPDGSWPAGSTATVLETLRWYGYSPDSPRIQRAVRSLGSADSRPAPAAVERERAALPRESAIYALAIHLQRQGHLTPPPSTFR
jgi:hypothetical protein